MHTFSDHLTSILRVSLTVVPNIFVLNIARWGIREFCIAIIAVNSASLRPSELLLFPQQPVTERLIASSVPALLLDKQKTHTRSPAAAQQIPFSLCTASPTTLQQIPARRSSPQLDLRRRIDNRQLHPPRARRAGIRLRGPRLPDDFATCRSRLCRRRDRPGERRGVPHSHR